MFLPICLPTRPLLWLIMFSMLGGLALAQTAAPLDVLILGVDASERAHGVKADRSEVVRGGLDEPARRLLPAKSEDWQGGRVSFSLKVDPVKPNYVTARFWGDDTNPNRLILFCEGKQIGYRHLGDIDILDIGDSEPGYSGRFFYTTSPLPVELTRGKTEVALEIRSNGPIWGYGQDFARYQKPMTVPTRGIYRVYTHTDGAFVPPADEKQGAYPANAPVRSAPGDEVLAKVKARVNKEITGILNSKNNPTQQDAQFLAKAWHVAWTPAYRDERVPAKIIAAGDAYVRAWRTEPKLAKDDPKQYNSGWFGVGPLADAIRLMPEAVRARLDEPLDDGTGRPTTRRAAWSELLVTSRDLLRRSRPHYTNQTMIQDMNIYRLNRGLVVIDPAKALPEAQARSYLYQAIGIEPWLGSDTDAGPARPLGDNYFQLTAKGLTKELGYVGNYGEILDWVTHIYLATAQPGQPDSGDPKIRAQLAKLEHARSYFRYPSVDAEGYRAMRMETIVGWRDTHYPGEVCYAERSAWEGSAIYSVAAATNPHAVGAVQQMFADNQFFQSVDKLLRDGGLRVTNTLMSIPDDHAKLSGLPAVPHRLPMTWTEPDFAWADEENGVVALKRGDQILYASLYWRSRYAVNGLARVHWLTPRFDRVAVVRQDSTFEDSGEVYLRRDWVNMGFGNGGHRYPAEMHSAHTGEKLPIAKVPAGVKFKPGDENIHAGKAQFYTLRHGDYLIAMNTTADQTFTVSPPAGVSRAPELVSGKTIELRGPLTVGPRSTVVLYLGR